MKTIISLILLAVGLTVPATAQQSAKAPSKELPQGTLLHLRAPEFSRWTITYDPLTGTKSPNAADAKTPRERMGFNRRVAVTKTKDIIVEQLVDRYGSVEKWCIKHNLQFVKRNTERIYQAYKKDSFTGGTVDERLFTDYSKSDFPGFEWISKEHFSEVRKIMNRDCIVFTQGGDSKESVTACVDLATRLPVVLQVGDQVRVYEFQAAPQGVLPLPAEIQKALAAGAK